MEQSRGSGELFAESIELAKQWSELSAFDAYFPLARVRLAEGDVQAAVQAIETARQLAYRSDMTEVDDRVADLQQAGFLVSQGDFEGPCAGQKRRLAPGLSSGSRPGLDERRDLITAHLRKYEQLVLARLFISQGRAVEALDLLSPVDPGPAIGPTDLTIEIQILTALACRAEGQTRRR